MSAFVDAGIASDIASAACFCTGLSITTNGLAWLVALPFAEETSERVVQRHVPEFVGLRVCCCQHGGEEGEVNEGVEVHFECY
jgi:hypothetical protein